MATVALALGSGGARGYAHIGAIEELEARGFEIVSISGTSVGAMVGGLYAADKLPQFTEWVGNLKQTDVIRLLDPSFSAPGAIKAEKVMNKVRSMLGKARIEDLRIPYTAVATDVMQSKEVWFQKGPLDAAIRASIAIPSLISSVTIGGRLFVDGGVLNPLPLAPLASVKADLVVAISLSGAGANHPMGNPSIISSDKQAAKENTDTHQLAKIPRGISTFEIMERSIETMQSLITRYRNAGYPPDLLVEVPIDSIGMLEFHKAKDQIELGRKLTARAIDNWGNK
jgi:NTE family protein